MKATSAERRWTNLLGESPCSIFSCLKSVYWPMFVFNIVKVSRQDSTQSVIQNYLILGFNILNFLLLLTSFTTIC